jgi:CheY-like chemotaxis protein
MPPKPLSDLTIVIVEDHDDTRKSIGSYLDRLGAKVIEARNVVEGLEVIKNNCPDLVLSDIQMPGGDGFGLVREIRLLQPDSGGSVPVIAMTAFLTPVERAQIINAGFQACLSKPFTPNRLVETILTLLNN